MPDPVRTYTPILQLRIIQTINIPKQIQILHLLSYRTHRCVYLYVIYTILAVYIRNGPVYIYKYGVTGCGAYVLKPCEFIYINYQSITKVLNRKYSLIRLRTGGLQQHNMVIYVANVYDIYDIYNTVFVYTHLISNYLETNKLYICMVAAEVIFQYLLTCDNEVSQVRH